MFILINYLLRNKPLQNNKQYGPSRWTRTTEGPLGPSALQAGAIAALPSTDGTLGGT